MLCLHIFGQRQTLSAILYYIPETPLQTIMVKLLKCQGTAIRQGCMLVTSFFGGSVTPGCVFMNF